MNKERKDISELLKEYYNRPLELIEENKKLKKKIDKLQKENEELKSKCNLFYGISTNFINKDIIRAKIKELENTYSEHSEFRIGKIIEVLKELLGE